MYKRILRAALEREVVLLLLLDVYIEVAAI